MLWVVLRWGCLLNVPIRQVFKLARRLRRGKNRPIVPAFASHVSGWAWNPCDILRPGRSPAGPPETPGAFYRGLRLMGVDGTVLDVPDSDVNAADFARPSAGAAWRRGFSPNSQAQSGRVGDPRRSRLGRRVQQ